MIRLRSFFYALLFGKLNQKKEGGTQYGTYR